VNDYAAVIDASFFLGAFLSEFCNDEEKKARNYISNIIQNNGQLYVPQLFWFEIGNVLTNAVKNKKDGSTGRLSLPQFLAVYQNIKELPIYTDPQSDSETQLRISNLAVQYNLTFYDASYLELAIRTSLPLKTFNKELLNCISTKRRKNSSQNAEKKRRNLGTWAKKGTFTEVGDGKITLEEFFGVKSLDEIEPLP